MSYGADKKWDVITCNINCQEDSVNIVITRKITGNQIICARYLRGCYNEVHKSVNMSSIKVNCLLQAIFSFH